VHSTRTLLNSAGNHPRSYDCGAAQGELARSRASRTWNPTKDCSSESPSARTHRPLDHQGRTALAGRWPTAPPVLAGRWRHLRITRRRRRPPRQHQGREPLRRRHPRRSTPGHPEPDRGALPRPTIGCWKIDRATPPRAVSTSTAGSIQAPGDGLRHLSLCPAWCSACRCRSVGQRCRSRRRCVDRTSSPGTRLGGRSWNIQAAPLGGAVNPKLTPHGGEGEWADLRTAAAR
jgi:hypothetical protein